MARPLALLLLVACASTSPPLARAALTLPCTGEDFAGAVSEPLSGDASSSCDLPWHARLTPAARALLARARAPPARSDRALVFGLHAHAHHPLGSLNTFLNLYASAAAATNRTLVVWDRNFSYAPAGFEEGFNIYFTPDPAAAAVAVDPAGGPPAQIGRAHV